MAYGQSGRGRANNNRERGGRDRDYDDTNRGVLFENDRKEKDTHPDMRGQIDIEGRMYWISAWWKEPRKGGPDFLSLSVERQAEARRESHSRSRDRDDDNNDDRRESRRNSNSNNRRDRDDDGREPTDHRRGIQDDEIPF